MTIIRSKHAVIGLRSKDHEPASLPRCQTPSPIPLTTHEEYPAFLLDD